MKNFIKSKKFIVSLIIILSLALAGGGYVYYKQYKSGNLKAKENLKEIKNAGETLNEENPSALKDNTYYSVQKLYDVLHRMSNGKIIAKDNEIWGVLPMNKENIEAAKTLVENVAYKDREYLLEVLTRWENGDFSQAVEEHNYFWDKLGGTVGKAIGLKE
ncbi:MAG: DUF6241 domain-containing protein [Clostridium sp.]